MPVCPVTVGNLLQISNEMESKLTVPLLRYRVAIHTRETVYTRTRIVAPEHLTIHRAWSLIRSYEKLSNDAEIIEKFDRNNCKVRYEKLVNSFPR